jgi:hypothetical protein
LPAGTPAAASSHRDQDADTPLQGSLHPYER